MSHRPETGWLFAAEGEMARRIRDHDWSETPLGAIDGWSERLKMSVETMLATPLVASIVCGPQRILIYNDAAARLYGREHPAALGAPLPVAFPAGYAVVEKFYDRAFEGESVSVTEQPLDTRNEGVARDYFDAWLTPVRDARGAVIAVHMLGFEVSERVRSQAALRLAEERQAFLLKLSDALRPLVDPVKMMAVASEALGRHLAVQRCGYGEVDATGEFFIVERDWTDGVMPSFRGRHRLVSFGPEFTQAYRAGRSVMIEEALADARAAGSGATFEAEGGVRASLGLPLIKDGCLVAGLFVQQIEPRRWTAMDEALAHEVAERTWAAVERARAEAALRESEERYRSALRVGRIGSWETDFAAGVRYWSPEGMALFGLDLRNGEGRVGESDEWIAALHPDDHSFAEHIRDVLKTEDRQHVEYRIVRPDGCTVWLHGFAEVSRRDAAGGVARLFNVATDVSETKKVEAALRESEERLRQFGEASQDVLWIRDAETFQWEYLTPAFETIYGLDVETALRGDNMIGWLELIVPEDREHAAESLGRVRDGEWVTFEYRIQRPLDGEIRWLRNTDFPIRDHAGKVARIGGIGHNITAVKEVEAALAAAELRQRALLEGIPQLVWRAAERGQWSWSSPQWSAYTGLSLEDSLGHGWLNAVHPDDRELALAQWRSAGRAGTFDVECRLRQATGGRYRWFNMRATPVRDKAGHIVEWLGTSTDIDDLRRLQNEQQVMVAELQHRTRNLIAVVRSIAQQTMAIAGPTETFRLQFNERLEALARVQGLLSKAGNERITIRNLIRMELDALGAKETESRISLDGPQVPLRNSVIQTLALALHELATNARKYGALATDSGTLAVHWSVRHAADAKPHLALEWLEEGIVQDIDKHVRAGGGYGRELIEQALPYALNAKTTFELNETGVRCTIELPLGPQSNRP